MTKEGFTEKVASEQRPAAGEEVTQVAFWGRSLPVRGNSQDRAQRHNPGRAWLEGREQGEVGADELREEVGAR